MAIYLSDVRVTLTLNFEESRVQKQLLVGLVATQDYPSGGGSDCFAWQLLGSGVLPSCLSEVLVFGPQEKADEWTTGSHGGIYASEKHRNLIKLAFADNNPELALLQGSVL
jgi:hypothetical protein